MANKHLRVNAKHKGDQSEFHITETTTNSPILPVAQLIALQEKLPELVQWVVDQTESEAHHRRETLKTNNRYVFIERIFSIVGSLLVCAGGLSAGGFLVYTGHDVAGTSIAGVAIGTLAVAYLANLKKSE